MYCDFQGVFVKPFVTIVCFPGCCIAVRSTLSLSLSLSPPRPSLSRSLARSALALSLSLARSPALSLSSHALFLALSLGVSTSPIYIFGRERIGCSVVPAAPNAIVLPIGIAMAACAAARRATGTRSGLHET